MDGIQPATFELGCWMGAAIAMTVAPRTRHRGTLLAVSLLAALCAGVLTRLANPPGWNLGKVDPLALITASVAAALVALCFAIAEWRSQRVRSTSPV